MSNVPIHSSLTYLLPQGVSVSTEFGSPCGTP